MFENENHRKVPDLIFGNGNWDFPIDRSSPDPHGSVFPTHPRVSRLLSENVTKYRAVIFYCFESKFTQSKSAFKFAQLCFILLHSVTMEKSVLTLAMFLCFGFDQFLVCLT